VQKIFTSYIIQAFSGWVWKNRIKMQQKYFIEICLVLIRIVFQLLSFSHFYIFLRDCVPLSLEHENKSCNSFVDWIVDILNFVCFFQCRKSDLIILNTLRNIDNSMYHLHRHPKYRNFLASKRITFEDEEKKICGRFQDIQ
jgi:hypothetical protein